MANITFTKTIPISEEFNPVPASQQLPDWYKETTSYISGSKKPSGNGSTTATIKRCMPVFDSLSAGYYLSTYTDIWVSQMEQDPENQELKHRGMSGLLLRPYRSILWSKHLYTQKQMEHLFQKL